MKNKTFKWTKAFVCREIVQLWRNDQNRYFIGMIAVTHLIIFIYSSFYLLCSNPTNDAAVNSVKPLVNIVHPQQLVQEGNVQNPTDTAPNTPTASQLRCIYKCKNIARDVGYARLISIYTRFKHKSLAIFARDFTNQSKSYAPVARVVWERNNGTRGEFIRCSPLGWNFERI